MIEYVKLISFGSFVFFVVYQLVKPKRDLTRTGKKRQLHNILLFVINSFFIRLALPISLVFIAISAQRNDIGIFNILAIDHVASNVVIIIICVIILDFAIYCQHVATHKIPLLWKIHKVHHSDHDMDVTTAIRFHPIELIISLFYKSVCIVLLGAPVLAVLIFESLLFIGPVFNHSNAALPKKLDLLLRNVIATPDVHRAHHSIYKEEQDTNYGFFLIIWDKLFSTYTHKPRDHHESMNIGLGSNEDTNISVIQMLKMPFT